MRLRSPFLLVLASVGAAAVLAIPARAAEEMTITFTPSLVSQYMDRGVRFGGASLQPTIEAARGDGAIGLWGNFSLEDGGDRSATELDVYGYYAWRIAEGVSVVPMVSWYSYPDSDPAAGEYRASVEPSLGVEFSMAGVLFTPRVYYDLMFKGPTWEMSAAYALALPKLGTELDFTARIGTYDWRDTTRHAEPEVRNRGDYWLLGVDLPFAVGTHSVITVGFAYTEGFNNTYEQAGTPREKEPAALGRGVVTLSYAFTF